MDQLENFMSWRFALQDKKSLSGTYHNATGDLAYLHAFANRSKIAVVCQSVEKSGHDNVMVAHDECFKNSRMVIASPDPLKETPKRILNSPQALVLSTKHCSVKRIL
jgi:hypothetical protein